MSRKMKNAGLLSMAQIPDDGVTLANAGFRRAWPTDDRIQAAIELHRRVRNTQGDRCNFEEIFGALKDEFADADELEFSLLLHFIVADMSTNLAAFLREEDTAQSEGGRRKLELVASSLEEDVRAREAELIAFFGLPARRPTLN